MSSPHPEKILTKRYRINPIELFLFIGVCSGFVYSIYSLFNQVDTFKVSALQPMQTQPNRALVSKIDGSDRAPAQLKSTTETPEENAGLSSLRNFPLSPADQPSVPKGL